MPFTIHLQPFMAFKSIYSNYAIYNPFTGICNHLQTLTRIYRHLAWKPLIIHLRAFTAFYSTRIYRHLWHLYYPFTGEM